MTPEFKSQLAAQVAEAREGHRENDRQYRAYSRKYAVPLFFAALLEVFREVAPPMKRRIETALTHLPYWLGFPFVVFSVIKKLLTKQGRAEERESYRAWTEEQSMWKADYRADKTRR